MEKFRVGNDSFVGTACRLRKAGNFTLGRWVGREPDGDVKPHGHAEAHFMYVPCADYSTCAVGNRASNGSHLVYNPPGTYHRDRLLGPGSFFTIAISESYSPMLRDIPLPAVPALIDQAASHGLIGRLIRACSQDDPDGGEQTEMLCLELLAKIDRPAAERKRPRWLSRVVEMLHNDAVTDISVDELSRAAGVHPVHLARTFRKFYASSPKEYMLGRRVERAAHALAVTPNGLTDIALATGFADQSHLSKHFRRILGVPPAEYRRLTR